MKKTKIGPVSLLATTALVCVLGMTGCGGNAPVSSGTATVNEPETTVETQTGDETADETASAAATVDEAADTTQETTAVTEAVVPSDPDNPDSLQVADSGWFETETGMIDMAVAIDNPNTTLQATDTIITVVGKSEDGTELFTGEFEVPVIPANTTNYYTYATGVSSATVGQDDTSTMPVVSSVEVSVSTPEWIEADSDTEDAYVISDSGTATDDFGPVFTGTVTASKDFPDADQTCVEVILLDGDGHIEGGYMKMVDATVGTPQDFEIYAVGAPSYASYQLVAVPWESADADDAGEAA